MAKTSSNSGAFPPGIDTSGGGRSVELSRAVLSKDQCIDRLIKQVEMLHITGLGRSDYYNRLRREEDVPKPIRIGDRSVRFLLSDAIAWVRRRAAGH